MCVTRSFCQDLGGNSSLDPRGTPANPQGPGYQDRDDDREQEQQQHSLKPTDSAELAIAITGWMTSHLNLAHCRLRMKVAQSSGSVPRVFRQVPGLGSFMDS